LSFFLIYLPLSHVYQVLLDAKADFSIATSWGQTPLQAAESNGKAEVVALIKASA
jgi:ankyrin repeat protein